MERIGKYHVVAHIGQGGMARVYLTLSEGQHGVQKLLVVKELREELAEDPELLASFVHEARIAARLNHPNIVQTYEAGSDGRRHFIAMEYLEGQPFSAILRSIGRPNVPLALHLRILIDLLEGLEYAHNFRDYGGGELSVIHRDVSPQNVFVTYDGQVKIVDFGIAKIAGSASNTQVGRLKGKLAYIAPEQAMCEEVDARADVFAAGIMLWEAIAGRRMSRGEDEAGLITRRVRGNDPKIRDVAPDAPERLVEICDRATALEREDRFPSAGAFQEALEDFITQHRHATSEDLSMSHRELGRLVADRFIQERARIQSAIQSQVDNLDSRTEPIELELVPVDLRATQESSPQVSLSNTTPDAMPIVTGMSVAHPSQVPPPPQRARRMAPVLAIGGVAAAATVAITLFVLPRGSESEPVAPTASGSAVSDSIEIVIRYPEGAVATLDGRTLEDNPYRVEANADGTAHELVVEQAGHRTVRQSLLYDRDLAVQVALVPVSGPAAAAAGSTAAPAAAPPPAKPHVGAWKPPIKKPVVSAESAKPPPPPAPSSTVHIDEQNPYKKNP